MASFLFRPFGKLRDLKMLVKVGELVNHRDLNKVGILRFFLSGAFRLNFVYNRPNDAS